MVNNHRTHPANLDPSHFKLNSGFTPVNPEGNLRRAIELHSQILHSETQAISARDLTTIEDILVKKDESLEILLSAKEDLGQDFESFSDLVQLFEQVVKHQQKNTENFRKLHIQQSEYPESGKPTDTFSDRVSRAYRK
jgi:uncharacterized protein YoxC